MTNKEKLAEIFTTVFYIGKIKYMPGTFGSLVAFPIWYVIAQWCFSNQITLPFKKLSFFEQQFLTLFIIIFFCLVVLFITGTYLASTYINYIKKEDPKEIVIDEVAGQLLAINLCLFSPIFIRQSRLAEYLSQDISDFIFLFLLPFILFRFFDIVKPWPINWLDQNIKGGIGVMLDDILAAVFAAVVQYAMIFTMIDWIG